MKVLVVGATGFIGSRLVSALQDAGCQVRCASRHAPAECAEHVGLDYARSAPAAFRAAVAGCQVVINAVGILREDGAQTFEALHTRGPRELFAACVAAGVPRVIQISALGAEATALSRYHRSKHEADRYLMDLPLDWAIVQPSLVYGAGGTSATLFDMLASLPVTPLPGGGRQRVQPVHVDDVIATIIRLVESPAALRCVLPVVGPVSLSLREFLSGLRAAMGEKPALALPIPSGLMAMAARIGDHLPGALLDSETLGMLERGNTGDAAPQRAWLGRDPKPVSRFIAASDIAEHRRAAALGWLLPMLRVSVAAMWFIAAIVSMGPYPVQDSLALLRSIGAPAGTAPLLLAGAVALDFLLGVLTLWPRRSRWLWTTQIALVLAYTAIISIKLPWLWLEPFGPVAKNLPILALLLLLKYLDRK
ncbi:MAG TPA: NAD(P)H-binding protein [Steroidobacteraceae bacterium]|nr:NAD(P)H-binding protein [Steroidobacteraceae bacterium]